ncbi:MAG: sodium:proton antiporter NhaD [Chitinophagaceae bacterium]|jgi:Na+/H+ antiporter NhaD/arsenite permease-like protein|nr:sodium:proton antiporter NhaD [Chitinophagaceae bacterium]MBK8301124.1 sodium:proton antiporter NhaD [Chitinophagaceae bacterium]MBK9660800.1 sodium:proton antiporter NhaD [Chitinophagaceae bacterium]MBK9939960.1 sodium:proton antiporter NhaD [Chitinophagaceae bacterium]HQW43126.1 sodium:proton antiporter NhaD [Chitinophagaceae bacterium]
MITIICIIFIVGYAAIALEHPIKINKAATALITGVLCWTVFALFAQDKHSPSHLLTEYLGEVAGILFFLLGAMTIVELIDAHDGFEVITSRIKTTSKRKLVWIVGFLAFFLSAVLDNLTTTIVLVSLLRIIIPDKKDRLLFAGLVVIAANAGGAWSPIGDVTTTMLWIGGQITAGSIIIQTILPSLVCFLIPAFIISRQVKGDVASMNIEGINKELTSSSRERNIVFWLGIGSLLFVPVFKTVTHLPPYMGILLGLGVMWVITEMIHSEKDEAEKGVLSVNHALRKIDTPSILFFLGILISIAALQASGVLTDLAVAMNNSIGNIKLITLSIGLLSAIVDNVPLVAAAQGMYGLEQYPTGHFFWEFLAYCAGTGGSCLIIGSAAGVAAMGLEKIEFFWYMKKIGWLALIGYLAGAGAFILQHYLMS